MNPTIGGNCELTKLLLDHGADPNARGPDFWTLLHFAVHKGHAPIVRLLLDHGADANAKALPKGVGESSQKAPRVTTLLLAANLRQDATKIATMLLAHGAGLTINESAGDEKSALMIAAEEGNLELVKLMVKNGADVNATDEDGVTALQFAAKNDNTDVVEFLMGLGTSKMVSSSNKNSSKK